MRQKDNETKESQKEKKGKMLILTEVVKNIFKGGFITEVYFSFFLITSEHFTKYSVVKCILSVILFQSLIDLTWTDLEP